ncbi:MAG: type IV conjugative transfer system lipoprotein TraV [Proteobacteria bacterium]|nr:type IV conjugative transfer system lipoprotein TraV [Pseudomonadota bacterium]
MLFRALMIAGFTAAVTGCSVTGLDAKDQFSCSAPDGVSCASVSEVNKMVDSGALPRKSKLEMREAAAAEDDKGDSESTIIVPKIQNSVDMKASHSPLVSAPKVIRIWIAPWEDKEGVLHDQSYIYAFANKPEWKLNHSREEIRTQYRAPSGIKLD